MARRVERYDDTATNNPRGADTTASSPMGGPGSTAGRGTGMAMGAGTGLGGGADTTASSPMGEPGSTAGRGTGMAMGAGTGLGGGADTTASSPMGEPGSTAGRGTGMAMGAGTGLGGGADTTASSPMGEPGSTAGRGTGMAMGAGTGLGGGADTTASSPMGEPGSTAGRGTGMAMGAGTGLGGGADITASPGSTTGTGTGGSMGAGTGGGGGGGGVPDAGGTDRSRPVGEPELIVIARPAAGLRVSQTGVTSIAAVDVSGINDLFTGEGISLTPLFGSSEERILAAATREPAYGGPDLSVYYRVEAPPEQFNSIMEQLRQHEAITAVFVKPAAELPLINDMMPSPDPAPPVTPDFTSNQFYLNAAPGGINARYAWTRPGGSGANVRVIDVEGAWRFSHEDLRQNQGGVVGGTQSTDIAWRNHGTAVIGVIGGDRNALGVTGIAPDANKRTISIFGTGQSSARAIHDAANLLSAGDIVLIELHRPGPRYNFTARNDQLGYIAVEWWPDDWAAIQYATSRGVIVVEAAGNGAEDLDDAIYNTPASGFPSGWTNPFNRANPDSAAIIVGAGAPPPGTHGRNWGPDRSRLDFSNYGSCIDVQGIGREVTTCGYGDLQGGTSEDEWYTDIFSGTSSSSPIVVGTIACVQGALQAAGRPRLNPTQARQYLRNTGSPQQDAPGRPATQRIGRRPDLRALIAAVGVGRLIGGPIAASADGRLELMVVGNDGQLWAQWQTAPSNGWSGWASHGKPAGVNLTGSPMLAASADGRLELMVVGNDGQLWAQWQTAPSNGWSGWASHGKPAGVNLTGSPMLAASADGRLELMVVGNDGQLWAQWQTAPSNGWSGWASHGKPAGVNLTGSPMLAASADGRLELMVVGNDGQLWAQWQTAPSNGWSGWASHGKPAGVNLTGSPMLAASADGRLELMVVGNDGQLWAQWQTAPSNGWSGWASHGKPAGVNLTGSPMLAASADGRLELMVVGNDGQLWAQWQTAPSNGWSGWASHGKPAGVNLTGSPMLAASADGRLELMVVGNDGQLWAQWQTAPSNGWSGWASHGKPAGVNLLPVPRL